MKTVCRTAAAILAAIFLSSCCDRASEGALEGVQLWDGGPYWTVENLVAENGTHQLTFSEAAARAEFGWRVPSEEDYMVLKEKCDWKWVEEGERIGYVATGPNGNSLFFPAEGYSSRNVWRVNEGGMGQYWTSTPSGSRAREIYMDENFVGANDRGTDNGLSVKLICDKYAPVMAEAKPCLSYAGRGNASEKLFDLSLIGRGKYRVGSVLVKLEAPARTVSAVRLMAGGEVVSTAAVAGEKVLELPVGRSFRGRAELEVCADIAEDAAEGSVVRATLLALCDGDRDIPVSGGLTAEREVLLARSCLFRPGDYGSKFWRIPAIRQLSDGTLLVVNDRRNESEMDIPGKIDVVYRYSTDGGRTWSEPGYIAKNKGFLHGFGDPSLVECEDGTVICMFCGCQTYSLSRLEDPQRSFYAVSKDFGRTWGEPVDITSTMWGPDADNPFCRDCVSSFFTSGNSLILRSGPHKGRILVANVAHYQGVPGLRNHAVYSDDNGRSWHVSDLAFDQGDEAKLVELNDGRILMSVRQYGDRAFVISEDGGHTWGPAGVWPEMHVTNCNGDLIRYNSEILLHTVPDSMRRRDVSVYVSYDDGKTWPYKKVICHGPSQYSSITVLPDGSIGAYIEEKTSGTELWYENFSLEWLLK